MDDLAALLQAVNEFEATLDEAEGESLMSLQDGGAEGMPAEPGADAKMGPCPVCGEPLEDGHTHDGEM